MAVKTNITINIVEPGSDVPVPDTGLFTHGIGGTEASIIATVGIVIIIAIAAIILYLRKKKINLKPSKHSSIILSILAIITSIATFTGLTLNSIYSHTNAKEGDLTVTAEDANLTIEVGDEPVFAVLPVQVTVEEATQAGYTLTAYTDNTDLVSTTNPTNKIPMATVEGDELTSLQDNTWGLALDNEPTAKDNKVYKTLSTDQANPTMLKTIDDYSETPANDTTTIYYGFYITPDIPYGTYEGGEISYKAEKNAIPAIVVYHGNDLYFNDPIQTTNTVKYIVGTTEKTAKYSHTPNIDDEGESSGTLGYLGKEFNQVVSIPGASKVKVRLSYGGGYIYSGGGGGYPGGFLSFWQGAHPDYTTSNNEDSTIKTCGTSDVTNGKFYGDKNDENVIITTECELEGDTATFAYWTSGGGPGSTGPIYGYYATVTGYDVNGNIIYLPGNTQVGGEYQEPAQDLPYVFLGWSEDKEATTATYESKNDIELNLPLTEGKTTELYAIWQHASHITLNDNRGTIGEKKLDKLLTIGKSVSLCSYYYGLSNPGYAFINWNTSPDGDGTTYNDCYYYTAPTDQSVELNLYAQWVPATTIIYDSNGGKGGQQQQTIREGFTSSIYGSYYFTRDGYYFAGWNTSPDGSGKMYYGGDEFTAPNYSDVFTLYAQWSMDCGSNMICYKPNGANTDDNDPKMSTQGASSYSDATLYTSNYKYDTDNDGHNDMGFIGWSEDPNAADKLTDNDNTNDPTIYGPNQTITTGNIREGMRLYATWLPPAEDKDGNVLTFQTNNLLNIQLSDTEGDTLANKPNGYVTALKDDRDNEVYAVARLADGNYWMIENLRLDNTAELTTENTNNPFTIDNSVAIKNNDGSDYNHLSPSSNDLCNYNNSDISQMAWCVNQSYLNTNNTVNSYLKGDPYKNTYSYGNYYNWYSATAGNGTYEKSSGNVSGDVCPAGWRLPISGKIGGNKSFSYLDIAMGGTGKNQFDAPEASNRWRSFPTNFILAGELVSSDITARNSFGIYWSSTAEFNNAAAIWFLGESSVAPGNRYKSDRISVRCIMQ